jgi:DNA-binding CsgD family transcriptional regulator
MKSEKISVNLMPLHRFLKLWDEVRTEVSQDENKIYRFFEPVIESIPQLALGEYYWQIFNNDQPFPKILMAQGAVDQLTPVDAETLISLTAEEIFSFYHPEDVNHVLGFVSNIFRIIIDEKPENRKKYTITIYARIKNGQGAYIWNSIQYPALYFDDNDHLLYGMALYTNINHLMKPTAEPMMTVFNSVDLNNQKIIYYSSDNIKGIQKIYPSISPREKEIITLLSQGKSSKQIADMLNLSKFTVDNHRQRLLKKFDVTSSSELVIKALIY